MTRRRRGAAWLAVFPAVLSMAGSVPGSASAGFGVPLAWVATAPPGPVPPGRIATPFGFTIPEAHPRLWWTPERLEKARAWLKRNPFTPGSSDHFHTAWKHAVAGTDCSRAIEWAMSAQVPDRQWSPKANGSDEARWNGETAVLVYDWCHDQLTPKQRTDFLSNLAGSGKGWNDYLAGISQQEWGGPKMVQSNYNWGNLRNNLMLGIASFTESPATAEALLRDALFQRWERSFVPWSREVTGGVGQEGTAYAASIVSYPIVPFTTVALGGRDLFAESGYFKESILWILYGTTPAPTEGPEGAAYHLHPFNDDELFAEGGVLARRTYYQDFMSLAADHWGGLPLGQHARHWLATVGAHRSVKPVSPFLQAQRRDTPALPPGSLPLDYYAKGIQYLYGRKAWDASSTAFFWQLGRVVDGVGHQHVDVGNFHLWRGGRWLTRETTGYSQEIAGYGLGNRPTDDTESLVGHNGLVFQTPLYVDGAKLMPSVDGGQSVVRRLESRPAYTYADVDMTRRYQWSSNYASYNPGAVVHVERELLFLRDLETTVVLDRMTTGDVKRGADAGKKAADQVTTFLLHLEGRPVLEGAAHLTAANGDQTLRVTTLVPASPTRRLIDEKACNGCARVGQFRVEVDAVGHPQRYFLHVLQARDAKGADLQASVADSHPADPETGTFTVTLRPAAGPATIVVFEKGRASRGGTLALAGAGPAPLTAGVQDIRYTDRGPEWGP